MAYDAWIAAMAEASFWGLSYNQCLMTTIYTTLKE